MDAKGTHQTRIPKLTLGYHRLYQAVAATAGCRGVLRVEQGHSHEVAHGKVTMRLTNAALTLVMMTSPCLGQMNPAHCRLIADRAAVVTNSIEALQENIETLTLAPLIEKAGSAATTAAHEVDRARDDVVPAMKNYLAAMRRLIGQLDICGLN